MSNYFQLRLVPYLVLLANSIIIVILWQIHQATPEGALGLGLTPFTFQPFTS